MRFSTTLRLVTPAFLGGATPKIETELRVPSIKGQLRFWYRATDPEYHLYEPRLFGSADAGQSAFLLVLEGGQPPPTSIGPAKESWGKAAELGYLGFGPILRDPDLKEFLTQRPYVKPDFSFTIRLLFRPWLEPPDRARIIRAVKAWTLFGGLGARCRRGLGSLQVAKLGTEWAGPSADISALEARCRECLDATNVTTGLPEYTAFSSQSVIKLVPIPNAPTDWKQALGWIGRNLSKFRSWQGERNFKPDHDLFYDVINGIDPGRCPARHVFGLPHNYFKPNMVNGKMDVLAERVTGHREDGAEIVEAIKRRGSPLFIRLHQLSDNGFVALFAFLPAKVLPDGSRLVMRSGAGYEVRSNVPTTPDWSPITKFLARFDKHHGIRTVTPKAAAVV